MTLGRVNSAAHVDHVRVHDEEQIHFFDSDNLWGLCASCHAVKSGLEAVGVRAPYSYTPGQAKQWWLECVVRAKRKAQ